MGKIEGAATHTHNQGGAGGIANELLESSADGHERDDLRERERQRESRSPWTIVMLTNESFTMGIGKKTTEIQKVK